MLSVKLMWDAIDVGKQYVQRVTSVHSRFDQISAQCRVRSVVDSKQTLETRELSLATSKCGNCLSQNNDYSLVQTLTA